MCPAAFLRSQPEAHLFKKRHLERYSNYKQRKITAGVVFRFRRLLRVYLSCIFAHENRLSPHINIPQRLTGL